MLWLGSPLDMGTLEGVGGVSGPAPLDVRRRIELLSSTGRLARCIWSGECREELMAEVLVGRLLGSVVVRRESPALPAPLETSLVATSQ